MRYLTILLTFVTLAGQSQHQGTTYDFSKVDPSKITVEQIDSITNALYLEYYLNHRMDSLHELREFLYQKNFSPKYVAFFVGYTNSKASLTYLNSGLGSLGLPEMSESFGGVPFGIDVRGKRILFSYVFTPVIYNSTSNAAYTVEAKGLQLELLFGYDVLSHLKAERFHLYPFASVGLGIFEMNSFRNAASSDVTNINDFVTKPSSTDFDQTVGQFTYGAELDIRLTDPAKDGLILGFRYGKTLPFAEGEFKINGNSSSFSSPDTIQEQFFSIVLKLYMRR